MAKVSELIEQAKTLEAQGDSAKALAIYQHVLPHLDAMPAIKADLSLKAGDLMLKLGNKAGALGMYESAGAQCALHGSTKGVLTVASKIQAAAPDRTDTLLSLAGQMVRHGHANHAVDVLIQYAKQANLSEMLQELEPLAGRSSDDVKPVVQMLLDQPSPPPAAAVPPPPEDDPRLPSKSRPSMDGLLTPLSLDEQLASMSAPGAPAPSAPTMEFRPPSLPSPPPTIATSSPMEFMGPPAPPPPPPIAPPAPPQFAGPPAPPPPPPPMGFTPGAPPEAAGELHLDVSPPLPPTPRETAAINMRASQTLREAVGEEDAPRRRPSQQVRMSGARPAPVVPAPRKPVGMMGLLAVPVVLAVISAGLYYFQLLPDGISRQVSALIAGSGKPASTDSVSADSAVVAAASARDSIAPTPVDSAPRPALPVGEAPHAPRPAATQPSGGQPPVKIEGLAVVDFREAGDRFQVVQRQENGQFLTLTGRPLADTVGEPAAGDIKLDSLPGDTAVAVTNFEGYVITVKGIAAPEALRTLLLQLAARSN